MKTKMLAVLVPILSFPLVHAQPTFEHPSVSGNAFLSQCSAIEKVETHLDVANSLSCVTYVEGVVEGVGLGIRIAEELSGKKVSHPFCIPENASKVQLVLIVLKHIKNHPETARVPSILLVAQSLTAAFPCKE